MDWSGYIAKALRSAGFRDHEIDTMTHDVVIRLLADPGALVQAVTVHGSGSGPFFGR